MMRFDWAQSQRSQWFIRYALDNSTTNNALVQQATLPSTGATSHSNYQNGAIHNTFDIQSELARQFHLWGELSPRHSERNGYLGFCSGVSIQLDFQDYFRV